MLIMIMQVSRTSVLSASRNSSSAWTGPLDFLPRHIAAPPSALAPYLSLDLSPHLVITSRPFPMPTLVSPTDTSSQRDGQCSKSADADLCGLHLTSGRRLEPLRTSRTSRRGPGNFRLAAEGFRSRSCVGGGLSDQLSTSARVPSSRSPCTTLLRIVRSPHLGVSRRAGCLAGPGPSRRPGTMAARGARSLLRARSRSLGRSFRRLLARQAAPCCGAGLTSFLMTFSKLISQTCCRRLREGGGSRGTVARAAPAAQTPGL